MITRRQVLRAMALGGGLIAGKIWIPGQTLISIPKPRPRSFLRMLEDEMLDALFANVEAPVWFDADPGPAKMEISVGGPIDSDVWITGEDGSPIGVALPAGASQSIVDVPGEIFRFAVQTDQLHVRPIYLKGKG